MVWALKRGEPRKKRGGAQATKQRSQPEEKTRGGWGHDCLLGGNQKKMETGGGRGSGRG